jgi:hypothetical protein
MKQYRMQNTIFDDIPKPNRGPCEKRLTAPGITITRYAARHWAVYLNGDLLAVTVYKKGALAIGKVLARPFV